MKSIIALCSFLFIGTVVLIIGCNPPAQGQSRVYKNTLAGHNIEYLNTNIALTELDGHQYVVVYTSTGAYEGGVGTSVCHHFGCPCLQKAEKE